MDWLWFVGLMVALLAGGAAFYIWQLMAAQTTDDFRSQQPLLRVTNLSTMQTGNVLTLTPEIENVGRGIAYDCVLHVGGWEGTFAVKKMYPRGARHHKQAVSLVLGPDAPIRAKPQSHGYLRLSYRDQWGLKYDCWYPVMQSPSHTSPPFNVQIDLDHPEVNEPAPSFWEMRALLRKGATQD